MTRPDSDRPPSFLWQGLLILLPVAALAVVGLMAVRRDRAAVQQDATRRAHEILAQMSEGFGRAAAEQLTRYDSVAQGWFGYCQAEVSSWPGGEARRAGQVAGQGEFEAKLKSWSNAFPKLKPEDVFPFQFSLKANGELNWPLDYAHPPQPADWLANLSAEQREAWAALRRSEYDPASAGDIEGLAVRFLATRPAPEAQCWAEFVRLRHDSGGLPAGESVTNLLGFARRCGSARDESGLPLSNLALAEALKRARQSGLSEPLWRWIGDEIVSRPSILVPSLLEQVQVLASTNSSLTSAAGGLRKLWEAQERLREIAELLRASGKAGAPPTANLRGEIASDKSAGLATGNAWVETDRDRWLCLLSPGEGIIDGNNTNGVPVQLTNEVIEARAYPRQMVQKAFAMALHDSLIGVPDYFAVFAELEGEPLELNPETAGSAGAASNSEVLAETVGVLSLAGTVLVDNALAGGRRTTGAEVETLPSKPRFALRLALVNRDLLFAHQRQRQMIFGSVIGFSTLAALIGFIAARRAFRRQLRLNQLKSNFVSSVSHELRAPIASVRLMAESLERGKVSGAGKQHEYFRFIGQECRRLSALIENVLDFSRIEQGRKQYEFEPTDVASLAAQTVKLMGTYATEREVALQLRDNLQPRTSNLQPSLDGRAIQQALVNLIDNAIKHSPKGGTVIVELSAIADESDLTEASGHHPESSNVSGDASRILLSVEDHGEGIPASEHQKIFERFYRSGSELRRQTQGVGIGLSIVKHIIEAHRGRVVVRSAPGQGSRFTIELPFRNGEG